MFVVETDWFEVLGLPVSTGGFSDETLVEMPSTFIPTYILSKLNIQFF